jgi:hypothetical protein
MKVLNSLFFLILFISSIFISCEKNHKQSLSGKWKVEEVGITGLSIFYEFRNDTITIKSVFDKSFIDSVGGDLSGTIEERYTFKSDSSDILTIEAMDLKTDLKGDYKIQIIDNKMIMTDNRGEIFNLKKINK